MHSPRMRNMLQKIDTVFNRDQSPANSPLQRESLKQNSYLLSPYQQVDLWKYFEKEEKKRKNNFVE